MMERWTKTVSIETTFHISPEIFSKQNPSSFNHRVKNASISFGIALTNLSKQNKVYLFQSKPQILCQSQRSSILAPLFNFFRFKHYGELNWNDFLKIYDTATFWLGRFLLIHVFPRVNVNKHLLFWKIYKGLFNSDILHESLLLF